MVKLLKFSTSGHDVENLSREDAVCQASEFEQSHKGRLVNLRTNTIVKKASDIQDEDEVLLLNQLQGG